MINFLSFRAFKLPLFIKPVSWLGLFCCFLQQDGSNKNVLVVCILHDNSIIFSNQTRSGFTNEPSIIFRQRISCTRTSMHVFTVTLFHTAPVLQSWDTGCSLYSMFICKNLKSQLTLTVQVFRQPKKYPLPIQRSRDLGDSQEPKTKQKKINFREGFFQKIPFLYFFLHKSWIWRTLGYVMNIFSYCHFHNASKEYFWSKKI